MIARKASGWTSLLVIALATSALHAADKPNIIYIMADDLGYGEVGCYGQEKIKTPRIDRLATEGTRFTQYYAGCTVCAPTRSVLMTGLHTGHTWVRGNRGANGQRIPLRKQEITVAEVLKKAGYATGIVGKWGLGEPDTEGIPNRQGFDFWFGYLNQRNAHSYYPPYLWLNESKVNLPGNEGGKELQYSHDYMTLEGINFIERNRDKPFFLYVAYTIPHSKYQVPSDAPYQDTGWEPKQKNRAAMITRMDRDIGRMMDVLDRNGLTDNTVVFFTSDNGPDDPSPNHFKASGPFRGYKRDLYEGGIRVPLIVRWPDKIKAGAVSDQVHAMWDFLPTAAELAGVEPPEHIDGISMLNAYLGRPQQDHDYLYWEFHERNGMTQAVRQGRWKALYNKAGKPVELYDLEKDRGEKNDLADKHPDRVAAMKKLMAQSRTESPEWPTK